jgi:F-type H+-transporting ATPase subunit gamma
MSLKDIKAKIKSVDRTRKVTKAMEAVSAVKMRKSQVRAISGRPYARAALSILERLSPSLSLVKHPLTEERPVKRIALVVVTSDKGLCGVLNAAVIKESVRLATQSGLSPQDIDIYAYGRKGAEYFERRKHSLKVRFDNISDDVAIDQLSVAIRSISEGFSFGAYDRVHIAFKSTFEQKAISHQLFPLSLETVTAIVEGITPKKGTFAASGSFTPPASYTVEPTSDEVLGSLLPRLASVVLYHALLESKASEHSARMVAMKNASDKSRDRSKSLTRTFNKARQAMITREVSEIVGGIEAMASA